MAIGLMFIALGVGGCLQLTAEHPPFMPKRLPDITFHVRIPSANFTERLNISATGDLYAQSSERGIATGMLSDVQVAELQKAFAGWAGLPPTYPSETGGPIYVIAYEGHAVTGGSLSAASPLFQQAVGELQKVMAAMRWER